MKTYNRKNSKEDYPTDEKTKELIAILDEAIAICDYMLESSQTDSDEIPFDKTIEMPEQAKLNLRSFLQKIFHKR